MPPSVSPGRTTTVGSAARTGGARSGPQTIVSAMAPAAVMSLPGRSRMRSSIGPCLAVRGSLHASAPAAGSCPAMIARSVPDGQRYEGGSWWYASTGPVRSGLVGAGPGPADRPGEAPCYTPGRPGGLGALIACPDPVAIVPSHTLADPSITVPVAACGRVDRSGR